MGKSVSLKIEVESSDCFGSVLLFNFPELVIFAYDIGNSAVNSIGC